MQLIFNALAAFAVALLLVPACRSCARRLGYVAAPRADRWHHGRETALMGGVAIAAVVLAGGLTLRPFHDIWLVIVCGAAAALFGLADDLLTLKPTTKVVVQIALASFLLFFGARLHWVESMTLDSMLTLLWLVGITNAFNLLDNMDGLCAGIGLIVAAVLVLGDVNAGHVGPLTAYLTFLIGALGGFLVYNFNPASIFMGDTGSLFIGLTLAAAALVPAGEVEGRSQLLVVIGAPLLVLLIPIFDATLVTVSRLLSGRSPSQGGCDHSSHRLVTIGLSERAAVGVLYTLAALGGFIGLALRTSDKTLALPVASVFVLAMVIFAVYLGRVRLHEDADVSLVQGGAITPLVVNFMYKRRVAEILLDLCLVPLSYYSAYRLRFEGIEYANFFRSFLTSLPIVVGLQITALLLVGGYKGVWRYFGLMDAVVFAKGVVLGTLSIVMTLVFLYRFEEYSRGVFIVYAALLMLALSGSRASFRLIGEFVGRRRAGSRVVIYGAAGAGSLFVPHLLHDPHTPYQIIGFIDDNSELSGSRVQGYRILGGYDVLQRLIRSDAIDSVVITAAAFDAPRLRDLESLCSEHGVSLARLHLQLEQLVTT